VISFCLSSDVPTIFFSTSSPIFAASLFSGAMVARWRLVCFAYVQSPRRDRRERAHGTGA
jgi:hypothetical protein